MGTTGSTLLFPGRARNLLDSEATRLAALSFRDRLIIWASIVVLTILAWAYLFRIDREMAPMMEHHRMMADMGMVMDMSWAPRDVLYAVAMWSVMMVGMMMPSAAPVLVLYAGAHRARGAPGVAPIVIFGLGYLLIWMGFSAVAALSQWALHEAALLSPVMSMANARIGALVMIAAGLYQLTPLKAACLKHCRTPFGFLMSRWRSGAAGALGMGVRHGAYCLGCCWALMAVLFVVGVMNLLWVAALATLVLVEKVAPGGTIVARVAGVAMIAAGAAAWLNA